MGNTLPTIESVAAKLAGTPPSLFAADEVRTVFAELAIVTFERDKAREALKDCVPYVYNVAHDPTNSPWRIETATNILARVREGIGV